MGGVARCSISAHAYLGSGAATRSGRSPPPPPPWLSRPPNGSSIHYRHCSRSWRLSCREAKSDSCSSGGAGRDEVEDWVSSPSASPYQVLGVDPSCCFPDQLKAAFRARVKEFHPDVCKDMKDADAIIKRVIRAYEILSKNHKDEPFLRPGTDPFEEPECEAYDIFINEFQCIGKECPYSCVKMAPHAFSFSPENGTARVFSQGHGDDYQVHLAVGQCPRRCIHYVTPAQREVLEDLLESALTAPYDLTEAAFLESLLSKAKFENNRYHRPKRKPKVSTEYVDWV
ncbi:hypothetical protein Cni_G04702 [Canna indica]|uniref:J domain-containing protein n=1 Tax=Canna indica TaxID=4628 RepID=A0AAQ3Q477_9LILI|nr:hypothetical protein Cni_G04702 [Canna indica]